MADRFLGNSLAFLGIFPIVSVRPCRYIKRMTREKNSPESQDPAFEGNSREGYGAPATDDPTREVNWTLPRGRFGGPDRNEDIEDSYGTDWEDEVEPVWRYNSDMPSTPFDEFMESYSTEVRQLAAAARRLVLEELPDAVEQVDVKSRLVAYGVGPKMNDLVCIISPLKNAVNLGFYRAVDLPDPAGLLEGTGKLHRHVRINSIEDLERPELRSLLQAAVTARQ